MPGSSGALPSISLPKGGGAIRGIEEKLTVDQPTGTARLTVPVYTSPGRQGFGPQLALSYDSGAGNGPYGIGWSLTVPSITRKTSKGLPRYDDAVDSDVFVLAGAEDLVPLLDEAGGVWIPRRSSATADGSTFHVRSYRPRVEAAFARIERWENTATGDVYWRTVSKDNVTSLYGQDASSRITDPGDPGRVFSWLLDLSFDDRGNAISYRYKAEDAGKVPAAAHELGRKVTANRYLKRILYGNEQPYVPGGDLPAHWCFEVVFDYGEHDPVAPLPAEATVWPCRPDPFSTYRPGFEVRTYRRCQRILMFHRFPAELAADAVIVRSTDLGYAAEPADPKLPQYSLLGSVTQTGWVQPAGAAAFQTAQLPPLTLGYSTLAVDDTLRTASADNVKNSPGDFDGNRQRWTDLASEGLPGILTEDDGAWYYRHNLSAWNPSGEHGIARFAPLQLLATKPTLTPRDADLQLTSLNGDGHLCAVNFAAPLAGWFELDADGRWQPPRALTATANIDWADPDLRFVDLDGDGLADVLISEDEALTWYQWVAGSGFTASGRVAKPFDEDKGPALVFADGTGSVFLADMTGDGLSDLVRIRNGQVCYWPNLGYGRFGAKITMDGAPVFGRPDLFEPRRVRLADIDGSGTADLAYLGSDTTTIWFNQSGNSWAAARELPQFPPVGNAAQASVFDLLGTGTAAAVWTSPLPGDAAEPLRYIDLTGGTKPYLLSTISDNMGATTTLTYAPSTRFYLQDRAAGTPWLTRLPFPVHVVERVETAEAISRTSIVSSYSYHHGFYDPAEREFRGFARVDQLDAEALPKESGTGQFTGTPDVHGDQFTLPPVWTRTWYHTGAFLDRDDIATRLAQEYYQGDAQAPHLAGTVLPAGGTAEELREACRALRGRILRHETYAQDRTAVSVHPYTTTEYRYRVDRLQPPAGNSYGAFHGWELEHVDCHYERNPADPRVSHNLTLAIDDYGNVTRHASAGYPRRTPALSEQGTTLVVYTEADYANMPGQAGFYRLGLPVEARSYELTGVAPGQPGGLFGHDRLRDAAAAAAVINYEDAPSGATPQRRLLKRARTIYRENDLSGPLALGRAESLALVDRTYQLAYTPGLLAQLFVTSGKITTANLAAQLSGPGGFADLDGDGNQWSPSARIFYSPDPAHPDAQFAAQHFYLPQGATDPWQNISTIGYDTHNLLVTQTTDAAGNTTVAEHNYRVLQPWLVTDPNLNRSGVRFDPLGMVVATAAMGKLLSGNVDEGDHLDLTTAEPSAQDDPTTRLDYNLTAYHRWAADPGRDPDHPAPVWAHTRARVRHQDPATPWLETYVYTDGLGRGALTKTQAEPGDAPERDAHGVLVRDGQGALVFARTNTRWVGTGRVVYDNKGNPVKQYEPFFDSSPVYDDETDLVQWGVTSITRYDPPSRPIRVDNPNGTYRTAEFDPWRSVSSDENDTVLASAWYAARQGGQLGADEADAAGKASAHAGTPAVSDFDTLGRVVRTVADNGPAGQYATVLTLDIEGQTRVTTDALSRAVLSCDYSLTGQQLHSSSADTGERWVLSATDGLHILAWDSLQHQIFPEYDALRRPTSLYVTTGGGAERLAEQITYGEALPLATAQRRNLRGAIYQQRDEAGQVSTDRRDFKGNVRSMTRQFLHDYRDDIDWSQQPQLDTEQFTTATTYDALNRPVTSTTPDGSVTTNTYNERGLIAAVSVNIGGAATATGFVDAVTYDPKGQRLSIAYGNGVASTYTYDPQTFRLAGVQTPRPAATDFLQKLSYTYDPVGNITRIGDAAQQTIFFNNQLVAPAADYTYDPIYRLTRALGREHIGQAGQPQTTWDDSARTDVPMPTDWQAMRNYTETYAYDPVGNFSQVVHIATNGNWTRTYTCDEPHLPPRNNHLTSTTIGTLREPYGYDAHGNVTSMPHLTLTSWDWKDQLAATARGAAGQTYYRYDASGERARKATDAQNRTMLRQRIYLGGYEVYREYGVGGKPSLERRTLRVSDGVRLICLVETTIPGTGRGAGGRPSTVQRYQLENHLGSAVLELDASAAIISYEEYYPYGSTSYQTGRSKAEVSLKRYRYTGKERDEESGFYYHGARYYAPWLGRWTACDPVLQYRWSNIPPSSQIETVNPYSYCRNNPLGFLDRDGRQSEEARVSHMALPLDIQRISQGPPGEQFRAHPLSLSGATALIKAAIEVYSGTPQTKTGRPLTSAELSTMRQRNLALATGYAVGLGQNTTKAMLGESVPAGSVEAEWLQNALAMAGPLLRMVSTASHLLGPVSSNAKMTAAIIQLNQESVTVYKLTPVKELSPVMFSGAYVTTARKVLGKPLSEVGGRLDVLKPTELVARYTKDPIGNVLVEVQTTYGNLLIPEPQLGDIPGYRSSMPIMPGLTGTTTHPPVEEFQLKDPVAIMDQPTRPALKPKRSYRK